MFLRKIELLCKLKIKNISIINIIYSVVAKLWNDFCKKHSLYYVCLGKQSICIKIRFFVMRGLKGILYPRSR